MVDYVPRSEWTSTSASGSLLTGSKLRGVAVHWPGTTQDEIGTSGIEDRLRGYRDFHVNSRGWRDIGYNFAIDQAGRVYMLRSTTWYGNMVGAHAASGSNPDANEEYVGVLLVLGDSETPSARMVEAFRDWYHKRFLAHWSGRTDVRGHRQVFGAQTTCPGDRALARIDDMTQPPEDDMPLTDAEINKIANAVWDHTRENPLDPTKNIHMEAANVFGWRDGKWQLTNDTKMLAHLVAIRNAVGDPVDEQALAQQLAALLVPAVLDELADALPPEVIEAATDRAIRKALGSLDDES